MALINRSSTLDEPWGQNHFPEGTPTHQIWADTNLWTKEHLALFHAVMLKSRPPEEASPKEILNYVLKVLAQAFDIWARAAWRGVAPTDAAVQLLNEFEPAMAAQASGFPASVVPERLYSIEVRRLLHQRKQYWLGRMLRKTRQRKEANRAKSAANRGDGAESLKSPQPVGDSAESGSAGMPAQELAVATTDLGADRIKMVDAFLVQCNRESVSFKVIRKHIWLAAGHAHARQFQYWQARSDKMTDEDDRTYRRIISMPPTEFLALLKNKGIFPPRS